MQMSLMAMYLRAHLILARNPIGQRIGHHRFVCLATQQLYPTSTIISSLNNREDMDWEAPE